MTAPATMTAVRLARVSHPTMWIVDLQWPTVPVNERARSMGLPGATDRQDE